MVSILISCDKKLSSQRDSSPLSVKGLLFHETTGKPLTTFAQFFSWLLMGLSFHTWGDLLTYDLQSCFSTR